MRDSIELYSNKKYNIRYYNERYIEQFDINQKYNEKQYNEQYNNEQYNKEQYNNEQYNKEQFDKFTRPSLEESMTQNSEYSSIFSFSFNEEQEDFNKVQYTELYELYKDNEEDSLDNYEENKSILQLPLSHDKYLLMKREWNKQLDTLSFSNIKTNNNNNSKKPFKNFFNKFLKKNNNKNKNISFYRVLIN